MKHPLLQARWQKTINAALPLLVILLTLLSVPRESYGHDLSLSQVTVTLSKDTTRIRVSTPISTLLRYTSNGLGLTAESLDIAIRHRLHMTIDGHPGMTNRASVSANTDSDQLIWETTIKGRHDKVDLMDRLYPEDRYSRTIFSVKDNDKKVFERILQGTNTSELSDRTQISFILGTFLSQRQLTYQFLALALLSVLLLQCKRVSLPILAAVIGISAATLLLNVFHFSVSQKITQLLLIVIVTFLCTIGYALQVTVRSAEVPVLTRYRGAFTVVTLFCLGLQVLSNPRDIHIPKITNLLILKSDLIWLALVCACFTFIYYCLYKINQRFPLRDNVLLKYGYLVTSLFCGYRLIDVLIS